MKKQFFKIMSYNFNSIIKGISLFICLWAVGFSCKENKSPEIRLTGDPTIDFLSKEILQNPEDPTLYAERGKLFYQNEGYDEAIADFKKALEIDSLNVDYLHFLADAYLDYYKSIQALETMETAANLFPTRIPTLLKLSEFQLLLKKYEDSIKTIHTILGIDPLNANAFLMYGMNYKEMGREQDALLYFQKAVENDPSIVDAWINLGQINAKLKNPIAAQYFESAVEANPKSVEALHAKADFLREENKLGDAISAYRKVIKVDPQYDPAFFNMGLIYLDLDSIDKARENFQVVIKVNPTHVKGYYYLGVVYELSGDKENARKCYEQVLKFDPDFENAKLALNQLNNQ